MGYFGEIEKVNLTNREIDVLSWSLEGLNDVQVAEELHITVHAVRFHWRNIFRKMSTKSKFHSIAMALRLKLISPAAIRPAGCTFN